jgi:UDP-glucose 4-epimerase
MNLTGKNILVTGGAGFIGSHLVDMLINEKPNKIIIFDNFIRGGFSNVQAALQDERVELFSVKGDITHLDELHEATKGVECVFHLASLCLAHCQDYPRSGLDVNVVGTYNVLEACVRNSVRRVIFASSSSVYGNAVYSPMDEKHPMENRNFYGASKIAGEALVRAFHAKYGIEYLAMRFMNAYGPRQDYLGVYVAVIMKIIDRLIQGLPPVIHGDGGQAFDFVYVEDVCKACILAMQSGLVDKVYNVSSGKQTTVLDVCRIIMKTMGKEMEPEFVPVDHSTLVTNRIGSTEKARKDLGFETKVSLEEGLRRVVEWKVSQSNAGASV